MSKIKAIANLLFKPANLKALLSFGGKGYLHSIGWFNAFERKEAVDGNGDPLPWVTYSFIDFVKDRISNEHAIFEFGSGSSTKYYAAKAASVTSVEHDQAWHDKVKATNPPNAEIIFTALKPNGAYSKMAVTSGKNYDVIIVDGRDRVNCCKNSIDALTATGVIVLDDSEREEYAPARAFLLDKDFRELSFSGISPGLFYLKSTSVFYRGANALNI